MDENFKELIDDLVNLLESDIDYDSAWDEELINNLPDYLA